MSVNQEKSVSKPQIVNDLYDFVLWILEHTPKFPKSHRFSLGDRLERTALESLELANQAFHAKDKRLPLSKLNERIDRLRLLLRLATDLRLISLKQQEYAIKTLLNIGRQVGGWKRSLEKKNAAPAS